MPSWGSEAIDLRAKDLPALKVSYLVARLPELGKVLELGSGEGKVLRTFARHRPKLTLIGCDVRDVPPADGSFEFRHIAQSPLLPADDRELDAVVFADVLEHVEDPAGSLDEVHRVLKPGGLLIGFVPLEGEPLSAYSFYRAVFGADLYRHTKEHVQCFSRRDVRALLRGRFELLDERHAYHALGQTLDATFFAAARLPRLRRFWWSENRYYHAHRRELPVGARALNSLLGWGNSLAYAESRALSRVPWLSAGLLFTARRP